MNLWNTIFKRKIINNLQFNEKKKYAEDYEYVAKAVFNSNSIYFNRNVYYHYIVNDKSVTNQFGIEKIKKKLDDITSTYQEILKITKSNSVDGYINLISVDFKKIIELYSKKDYLSFVKKFLLSSNYKMLKNSNSNTFKSLSDFETKITSTNYYLYNKIIKKAKKLIKNIIK